MTRFGNKFACRHNLDLFTQLVDSGVIGDGLAPLLL
jgi:hypothetical protein